MKEKYSVLLDKKTISSSIIRLAHEIYERNKELDNLQLFLGKYKRNVYPTIFDLSNTKVNDTHINKLVNYLLRIDYF